MAIRIVKIAVVLLVGFLIGTCQLKNEVDIVDNKPIEIYTEIEDEEVRNVIFFLGDGMGFNQVLAASDKYYGDGKKLYMERMPFSGSVNTSPVDDRVTDSAAGATAFASGHKTLNGMLGVTPDGLSKVTLLEALQQQGYATGIITTSELTDASPAAFYAHINSRRKQKEIGAQLVVSGVDVLIGAAGVLKGADLNGIDFKSQFIDKGYKLITTRQALLDVEEGRIIGLFNEWGSSVTDLEQLSATHLPDLAMCVESSLKLLSEDEDGFFLFVEDEGMDTGGHKNLTDFVLNRVKHMDDAIAEAVNFAFKDRHTLIIVTADHETGGLTLLQDSTIEGKLDLTWSTTGHTRQSVPIFAFGPQASQFEGNMENTEVAKKLGDILGLINYPEQ